MKAVGIKELKTNPGLISKAIESDDYLLISKRGRPNSIPTSLDNGGLDFVLKKWLLIQAYSKGNLSLGQLASALDQSYSKTLKLLGTLGIPTLDYDLDDELDTIEDLS